MPEAILKAELFPLFNGYWGYRAAPLDEAIEQRLVLIARKRVEARKNAEVQERIDERQRELESRR